MPRETSGSPRAGISGTRSPGKRFTFVLSAAQNSDTIPAAAGLKDQGERTMRSPSEEANQKRLALAAVDGRGAGAFCCQVQDQPRLEDRGGWTS